MQAKSKHSNCANYNNCAGIHTQKVIFFMLFFIMVYKSKRVSSVDSVYHWSSPVQDYHYILQ